MRVYRASSLGYSLEQLVAPHLGYEPVAPPEWLQERFDEGTALEPIVLAELERLGWTIISSQLAINSEGNHQLEVAMEVIPGKATVRGHLDAVGIEPPRHPTRVVEVKSMAEKSLQACSRLMWDTPGLIQKYKWQLSSYMLATGLEGVLVVCSKGEDGVKNLLYMYAEEPFYTISDIALKISEAEKHISEGTLPEGCQDYPCPYFHLHAPSDNPIQSADEELDDLMAKWLSLDNFEKAYKKEKDDIRAEMLAITGVEGVANVRGSNGVTVTTTWQEASEYVTKKKAQWVTRVSAPRKGNRGD